MRDLFRDMDRYPEGYPPVVMLTVQTRKRNFLLDLVLIVRCVDIAENLSALCRKGRERDLQATSDDYH